MPIADALVVQGSPVEIRPGRTVSLALNEGRGDCAIFLCHGAGGAKNQWRRQWTMLAAQGRRVVAWDFAGHGQSEKPRSKAAYDGREFLADYLAILERYGAARNVLIGHSYGARLTLGVLLELKAQDRLDRVERAILLGAPPPIALGAGPISTWPLWLLILMRPLINANFLKLAWAPTTDRALVRHENEATRSNTLFMMKALLTQSAPLDVAALSGLNLPIMILAGAQDGVTPPAGGQMVADALPQARFEVLGDCGHQIMLEQPAETNALISDFVGV
jgi:pimeloyl-ACP methyl ester carboxylesterase